MWPRVRISTFDIESLLFGLKGGSSLEWEPKRKEDRDILFEFTRNDVRENLELTMRVCTEPIETGDAVFVDYAQRAVLLVFRVLVPVSQSFCQRSVFD